MSDISRREFLKDASLIAGSAAISSVATFATTPAEAADAVTLSVYDPTGAINVTQLYAKRLDSLDGKVICEIADDNWQDERTFPAIEELIKKQYPTAKIITWDKFTHGTKNIQYPGIVDEVKKAGGNAVLLGNAG